MTDSDHSSTPPIPGHAAAGGFDNPFAHAFGGPSEEELTQMVARRGAPLAEGMTVADQDAAVAALRTVYDPEIPVNIYDLGLIYTIDIHTDGSTAVDMTLTAPGCPVAGEMPGMVADALATVEGIGEIEVRLTFEPAWSPAMMSDDAKMALDIY